MRKKFLFIGFLFSLGLNSQELNCNLIVNAQQTGNENVQVFKTLEKQLKETTEKFNGKEITRPPHWGGFLVKPVSIEFWQGRPNRMHDRMRYSLQKDFSWKLERLAP